MAYEIISKKRFTNKVVNLLAYLETEWSEKVSEEFLRKLRRRLDTVSKQLYIGSASENIKKRKRHIDHKYNKVFYKISGDKIIVLNVYDTRMNPTKNLSTKSK